MPSIQIRGLGWQSCVATRGQNYMATSGAATTSTMDLAMSQVTAQDKDKKFTEAMDLAQVMLTVADDGLAGGDRGEGWREARRGGRLPHRLRHHGSGRCHRPWCWLFPR